MGLIVTAFTTSIDRTEELFRLGASAVSHSTNIASLKGEEGKYDLVINTLFVEDD